MSRRKRESEPEYLHLVKRIYGHLGRTRKMTWGMWQVLSQLVERCEWGNRVPINQADIARDLGCDPSTVNRALRQLLTLNVVKKQKEPGRHPEYYLNAHLFTRARTGEERRFLRMMYGSSIDGADEEIQEGAEAYEG